MLIIQVVRRLLDKPSARVVIVFLRVEDAGALLRATRRLNETGRFVWIASDGWGKEELPVLGGNDVAAEGALTIELQSARLPEFDSYFRQLRPATNDRNPWFREYWERRGASRPDPRLLASTGNALTSAASTAIRATTHHQPSPTRFTTL